MIALISVACALSLFVQSGEAALANAWPSDDYIDSEYKHDDLQSTGKGKGKTEVLIIKEPKHKPPVTVDYYQPAFREPLELVALSKSLLNEQVRIVVEPEAGRLRIESESRERVANAIRLFQFLDRSSLEFSIEVSFNYMRRLERLGYFGEFAPVLSGVLTGVLEKRETSAEVFTTASESAQRFSVLEGQSVEVYTGRTQIDLKLKEVYVSGDKSVARMESYEQYCGFRLTPQMTPVGPRVSIDPFCNIVTGTDQEEGFSGPKVTIPVELGRKVALLVSDDPAYPQAQRLATALFVWAQNRLEREPVVVFEVKIRGLDEFMERGEP